MFHPAWKMIYFYFIQPSFRVPLWATDGTAAGTVMVASDSLGHVRHRSDFVDLSGVTYFLDGINLYKSDGTPSGTSKVADLSSPIGGNGPRDLVARNYRVFFVGFDELSGEGLS